MLKKTKLIREFLHELGIKPPGESNNTLFPCMTEKMVENLTNCIMIGANLQNFADASRIYIVNVPTANLILYVTNNHFTKISVTFLLRQNL